VWDRMLAKRTKRPIPTAPGTAKAANNWLPPRVKRRKCAHQSCETTHKGHGDGQVAVRRLSMSPPGSSSVEPSSKCLSSSAKAMNSAAITTARVE